MIPASGRLLHEDEIGSVEEPYPRRVGPPA